MSDHFKKNVPIYNKKTKLSRKEAFELEVDALGKLEENYKCYCSEFLEDKKERYHFPKIVKTVIHEGDIYMTHKGDSLDKPNIKNNLSEESSENIKAQLTCIMKNLENANIKHVDCPTNGQNICWDGDTLSLIDFNACIINNNAKSNVLKKWLKSYTDFNQNYNKFYAAQLYLSTKN